MDVKDDPKQPVGVATQPGTSPQPQATPPAHADDKTAKIAELQKKIDALIEEREKLKA